MKYGVKTTIQYWERNQGYAAEVCYDSDGIKESHVQYDYLEGAYRFNHDAFFEKEIGWILSDATKNWISRNEVVSEYGDFMTPIDQKQLIQMFDEHQLNLKREAPPFVGGYSTLKQHRINQSNKNLQKK